jgi:hypothetical protein
MASSGEDDRAAPVPRARAAPVLAAGAAMEGSDEDAARVPPPIVRLRGGGAGAGAQAPQAARAARGARGAAGAQALPLLLHMGRQPQREAPGAARGRAAAPAARAAPPPRAAPAPKRPRSAGADSRSAAGSAPDSGGESDEEKDSGGQKDSEADSLESTGWAGDEEGEGGEVPRPPRGHQRRRAVRPITDIHQLEPHRLCTYGCGAIVWPEEGGICCGMGKHILGPEFNPPIDAEYRVLLDMDHISRDSRLLNAHLAMATQSVTPSRKDGGLTWSTVTHAGLDMGRQPQREAPGAARGRAAAPAARAAPRTQEAAQCWRRVPSYINLRMFHLISHVYRALLLAGAAPGVLSLSECFAACIVCRAVEKGSFHDSGYMSLNNVTQSMRMRLCPSVPTLAALHVHVYMYTCTCTRTVLAMYMYMFRKLAYMYM